MASDYDTFFERTDIAKARGKLQGRILREVKFDYLKKKIDAKSPEQRTAEEDQFAAAIAIRRIAEKIKKDYRRKVPDLKVKPLIQLEPEKFLSMLSRIMD